jgi:hypothetical protein
MWLSVTRFVLVAELKTHGFVAPQSSHQPHCPAFQNEGKINVLSFTSHVRFFINDFALGDGCGHFGIERLKRSMADWKLLSNRQCSTVLRLQLQFPSSGEEWAGYCLTPHAVQPNG